MRKTLLFSFVLSTALLAHPPGLNAAADQRVKARIGVDRQRVKVGEAVHFTATASLAGKGAELVAAFWDFNDLDQVGVDALGDSVSHVYNHTGAYSVRLTVENNIGERNQATAFVEVLPDTDQGPLITDNFAGGKYRGIEQVIVPDRQLDIMLPGCGNYFFSIFRIQGHGFFNQYMTIFLNRRNRQVRMKLHRR